MITFDDSYFIRGNVYSTSRSTVKYILFENEVDVIKLLHPDMTVLEALELYLPHLQHMESKLIPRDGTQFIIYITTIAHTYDESEAHIVFANRDGTYGFYVLKVKPLPINPIKFYNGEELTSLDQTALSEISFLNRDRDHVYLNGWLRVSLTVYELRLWSYDAPFLSIDLVHDVIKITNDDIVNNLKENQVKQTNVVLMALYNKKKCMLIKAGDVSSVVAI